MIDKLSSSNSEFKIIALSDQLLNPVAKYENYSTYPEERQKIIDLILNEGIKGVVFLVVTGILLNYPNWIELEHTHFMIKLALLLNSTSRRDSTEINVLRVSNTWVGCRNFAILNFTGSEKYRTITIKVFNSNGIESRKKWN